MKIIINGMILKILLFRENFKDFLLKNCEKYLSEQKEIIKNTFYEWKKDNKQVDDVSVMGFKIFESYGDVEFF